MTTTSQAGPLTGLRELLGELFDIRHAAQVLVWDMETYMPAGGIAHRAQQLSTLQKLAHERFVADETGDLLAAAEAEAAGLPFDSDDASLVRVARRDYDHRRKVPTALVAEIAEVSAKTRPVWVEARRNGDWGAFAPNLERLIALQRRLADGLGWETNRYDALLDSAEPGLTTAELDVLFADIKAAVVPLAHDLLARGEADDAILQRPVPPDRYLPFCFDVAVQLGLARERSRQDLSAHPFCVNFGYGDVRITNRTIDGFGGALFSAVHESGHAMYEQGVAPALDRTPLASGASPGMHESQSRLWENLVGRSRPFADWLAPKLREAFPSEYGDVSAEQWHAAANGVRGNYIRVNADEVTYNLHILLRYELERRLLDGDLAVEDVPEAWNEKVQEYLGLPPPAPADGPLQDIHWSGASFGNFPSYTLGNVIGAQLMEVIRRDLPDLDDQVRRGQFAPLLAWLQDRVYRHGRKFTPGELLDRVTGSGLSARAWIDYIRTKVGAAS